MNRLGRWGALVCVVSAGAFAAACAGATLKRDGQPRAVNTDYFVLVRDGGGAWRIVNGSYPTKPVVPQR